MSDGSRTHSRTQLNEMLPRAVSDVVHGAEQIAAQQERVADLERGGCPTELAKRLLELMEETHRLQLGHVELLTRELDAAS